MRVPKTSANDATTGRPQRNVPDPLDDAVSLSGSAGGDTDEESNDDVLGEDERNATGGALPATDDEDNDHPVRCCGAPSYARRNGGLPRRLG